MKRWWPILLALLLLLPVAAVQLLFNGDTLRRRAEDAVRRATGRELTIAGPVGIAWSLAPTIKARDVSLANPPGYSRPSLLHADAIEARVSLLGLLSRRIDLERIAIAGPDLKLERDAAGRPNWLFAPPAATPSTTTADPAPAGPRFALSVGAIDIHDARLALPGLAIAAPALSYDRATGAVTGALDIAQQRVTLSGTAGPIQGDGWPLAIQASGGGIAASLSGTSASAALVIGAPDLAAVSALAGVALPPLRDVRIAATLSADGLHDLQVQAGAGAFGALRLQSAALSAPNGAAEATLRADAALGGLPIALTGTLGSLAGLSGAAVPLGLQLRGDDLALDASGTIGGASGQLALTGRVADLAALGQRAGIAVPAWRDVTLAGAWTWSPTAAALHGLTLASAQADVSGDIAWERGPRPTLSATLNSSHLDADSLRLAPPAVPPPAVIPPPGPAATPGDAPPKRLFPDEALPFASLQAGDADIRLALAEITTGGRAYRDVRLHAVLHDGLLRLDPASVAVGDKTLAMTLSAAAEPPVVAFTLDGRGLAAGPALALFGGPAAAAGTIDLHADLHARGGSVRALAATLDGEAGLAMVDGEVDNAWLEAVLADALRAGNLPFDAGGRSSVRCAGLRADATAGAVQLRALTLDTSKLKLDGTGQVDLGAEAMDLRLRPVLRLGGSLGVPVRLRGPILAPKVALDAGALSPGRVGILFGGAAPADTCGPALALARDGRDGPMPTAPAAPR